MTIFSAPNYCGSYQNRGAIAISRANQPEDEEQLDIRQFDPNVDLVNRYALPQDLDVLQWSIPFLCDCVSKMFYALLSRSTTIYDAEEEKDHLDDVPTQEDIKGLFAKKLSDIADKKKQIEVIKNKIRAVGRMSRLWGIRKTNCNLIMNLKEMCPDGKIPAGTLIEGKKGITD